MTKQMNLQNVNVKSKILVSLLLVFAGVVDLFLGQLVLNTSLGIAPIFLVLATVFILQDVLKWVRIALLILMGAIVLYQLINFIADLDIIPSRIIFMIIQPAAIPLYSALLFIGGLSFLFLKTNKIIQNNK